MVIVDTTVWVDYFKGVHNPQTDWLNSELELQRLGITELILCEVLQGVRDERTATAVEQELKRLQVFETGTAELAVAAARNYRTLRGKGLTVRKTIDCLIATFCITGQHALIHVDRDFDPFETHLGLNVIHP